MHSFLVKAATSFSFNEGAKEISRICQPFLNEWGFENFYYVRITKEGRLIYLTNHVDFAMNYWEAGLPLRVGFGSEQSYALDLNNVLDKPILDFTKGQHCFDGISFIDRFHDTVQFATFFRSFPSENASQFYLKNQFKLHCWLREFEWKNRALIKHAEQNSMLLPEDYLEPQQKAFYPERRIKLSYHNIQSKISFRELDCLHLHSKGFTCPRIASMLNLSSRTVETHLDSVKNCFGLSSRDDLAALAYANPLIHTYSPRFAV